MKWNVISESDQGNDELSKQDYGLAKIFLMVREEYYANWLKVNGEGRVVQVLGQMVGECGLHVDQIHPSKLPPFSPFYCASKNALNEASTT